jgi:hypothetical protein
MLFFQTLHWLIASAGLLTCARESQLTKRETAIVQNQLKNAQSPSRPVHTYPSDRVGRFVGRIIII